MIPIIDGAIVLATEVFKYINTQDARKYLDQLTGLKQDLKDEQDKGYDSDDAKIEDLYAQIKLAFDACQQELILHLSQSKS